ncbi:radical SAM family heme chaperone HemW [Parvularcula oceani]|uniref:radical SAM family heme chaperone HemW n=1 Tax=Parvularcula oceani TaxID=1247963 RepID=UPI0004E15A47|nr:radical SAM family heme chaperone HemW [Parvularcula oceani]
MSRPTGLYVHWPYCARICPYCDFNVRLARDVGEAAWAAAFLADLAYLRDRHGPRPLVSLYVGGGTPSLMPHSVLGALIEAADETFGLLPGAEVTLEANPNDVAPAAIAAWQAAGVTRLSLGVQSFQNEALAFLGRDHDAEQARRAIDLMLGGFERSTFDLIYARPGQGLAEWEAELKTALSTGILHLSLYQLTVEPGTAFGRAVERGRWQPAPEGLSADSYALTDAVTRAAGLPLYEVSSHAAPGHEAVHNALYWADADWLAIGPGAHGRLTTEGRRIATEGQRSPARYLAAAPEERLAEEPLSREDWLTERIAGGLRPAAGLPLAELGDAAPLVRQAAAPLLRDGFLVLEEGRLAATAEGRLVLDALTLELSAAL